MAVKFIEKLHEKCGTSLRYASNNNCVHCHSLYQKKLPRSVVKGYNDRHYAKVKEKRKNERLA